MLVSVLMPSRNRPDMADESIKSLGEGDFEVLMYVDDDDSRILQYKDLSRKYKNVKMFVEPRLTYYRFHDMINFLSEKSTGDWLMLWNDDAFMHGGWLKHFKEYDPSKVNVMRFGDTKNNLNLFPAISRKTYKVQGYYSKSPHCDSWAMDMSKDLGCERWVHGMNIEHRRDNSDLKDDTKSHTVEAYKTTVPQHGSPEVREEYSKALDKLKEFV